MSSPLSPQAKQKIAAAYKKFRSTVKRAAHKHRENVKNISLKIDSKHVDAIKKKIGMIP